MNVKIILAVIIIAALAMECKNKPTPVAGVKSVSLRDWSINKNNAYNDIFLDSTDVEKFIAEEKPGATMASNIRAFYNARNFEFAWFASTGLIEQAFSFHSLYCTDKDCDTFNKSLEARLDRLRAEGDTAIILVDATTKKTEMQLTQKFIEYSISKISDTVSLTDLATYIPAKKTTIYELADSVLKNNNKYSKYASQNDAYRLLGVKLKRYVTIARAGGWPTIDLGTRKLLPGASSPAIAIIKKRLQITGELPGNDSSGTFTPELAAAVKKYQADNGYDPTGAVTASLVKDMNMPAVSRVQKILLNMQRMRWMPEDQKGLLILVNIPAFEVYIDSAANTLFKMDVVVGAEGHNTTMFSGNLNQIVFSPYWNVPISIVKKEIVPGIARDKNYIEKHDMEITGHEGGLPVVRQKPGPKCALGKVKFLFPNSFNIYLHDSPEKGLFKRNERDLSHGCIRLSDAPKLAYYLLQTSPTWTREKIDSAMNSGKEQFVKLQKTVPVVITYYTAWVDKGGELRFADDIYGHDKKMAVKMFANP